MNALNIAEYMQTVGLQARQASALMARADAATKARALRTLAALLRANVQALQNDNAKDIERATANGLSAPMVDRLKLTPKVIETVAEGCEQLATMPDVIGEIIGVKQQPSGIQRGPDARAHRRVRHDLREPAQRHDRGRQPERSRAATPASCAAARKRIAFQQGAGQAGAAGPAATAACPPTQCNWCKRPTARPWAQLITMPQYVDVIIPRGGKSLIERISA
jgi:glutamate-5-semialdehyde dehydrogenase